VGRFKLKWAFMRRKRVLRVRWRGWRGVLARDEA
jgi:hypothetical protein